MKEPTLNSPSPPSSSEMEQSSLLGLPDDALLAVLAHLHHEELLDCRRVCRRLRDLCLHPDLWRSVELGAHPALRLAPCVGAVLLEGDDIAFTATIMATSTCIIKILVMNLLDEADVDAATTLLRRVSDIGGLEELRIDFHVECTEAFAPFFTLLLSHDDLRKLDIWCAGGTNVPVLKKFSFDLEVKPSLVRLDYLSHYDSQATFEDHFLHKLLSTHAATLQDVGLGVASQNFPSHPLLSIPNLRSLSCPADTNLREMLSAAKLNTIDLTLPTITGGREFSPGALAFLCKASHLRSVCLWFKEDAAPLLALASSPSARLIETLRLEGVAPAGLEHVAASLQHFPSLKTLELELDVLPSHFRFVSPSSAPSLSTLTLSQALSAERKKCPHDFLHGPVLQDLLTRNPGLHVRLHWWGVSVKCECQWCKWGCHAESNRRLAYSSHQRKAGCPSDCYRVTMLCPSCNK